MRTRSAIGFGRRKSRGTTLIFALIILAVAAMILTGAVMVSGALVEHTIATKSAVTRRLTLENSRALATQFVREKMLRDGGTGGITAQGLAGVAGRVTVSGGSVWSGTNRPAGSNPFSPAGDTLNSGYYYAGFSTNLTAVLWDGVSDLPWNFEARTRTPTLGYDLVSYVASGTAASITSANAVGTTNGPFFSGTFLNAAFPPDLSTPAFVASATSAATGTSSIAVSSGSASNSEYTVNGGTVTLFLNGTNAARTFSITGTLRQLNFTYTGTYGVVPGFPLRVVCSNLSGTSSVNLSAGSVRPVYLIYSSPNAVTINHTSTPRLTALFVNAPVTIQSGTIQGGIRSGSSGSISVTGGTLNILRETDPGLLDEVTVRRGWLESYRND